jgi:carbon monoxide dehydrogenase subunit G
VEIKDSFTVAAPPEQVWEFLLDVERVAPCMPGAELTEVIDDSTWGGRVKMKMGPVTMKYAGRVSRVERDDENRRMTLLAEGSEESGKGAASATVKAAVESTPEGGSQVTIVQELALSGAAAQFGGRMIADVSAHLTKQFAGNLSQQLAGTAEAPTQAEAVPALRLACWALLRAVGRLLRLPWTRSKQADR